MNNSGKGKMKKGEKARKKNAAGGKKFREGERERKSVERVPRQAALDKNNCCTQRQDSNSRGHSVSHVPCLSPSGHSSSVGRWHSQVAAAKTEQRKHRKQ